jgi:hypothetical protein
MSSAINRMLGDRFLGTAPLRVSACILCLSLSGIVWGQSAFGGFSISRRGLDLHGV